MSVHEQIRRATTVEELQRRARRVPAVLDDLLSWGMASGKVIAVYSSILDTIVRRTITLTFAQYPDLSLDAFTWLSLGSNGRREAVLSSDIDSAVAFGTRCDGAEIDRYRAAFADIQRELAAGGYHRRLARRDREPTRVLPHQRRVARGRPPVDGGARAEPGRDDDVVAGRRAAHPR